MAGAASQRRRLPCGFILNSGCSRERKDTFFTSLYSSDIGTRGHFILLFYMHFLTLETWTGGGGSLAMLVCPGLGAFQRESLPVLEEGSPRQMRTSWSPTSTNGEADSPSSIPLSVRNQVDFTTTTRDLGHLWLWGC